MLYPVFSGRWDSVGVRLHRGLAFEQRACGGGALSFTRCWEVRGAGSDGMTDERRPSR